MPGRLSRMKLTRSQERGGGGGGRADRNGVRGHARGEAKRAGNTHVQAQISRRITTIRLGKSKSAVCGGVRGGAGA